MLVMSMVAKCFMTRRTDSLHTDSARLASITAVGNINVSFQFVGIQFWNRSHGWLDKIDLDFWRVWPFPCGFVVLRLLKGRPSFNDLTALHWPTFRLIWNKLVKYCLIEKCKIGRIDKDSMCFHVKDTFHLTGDVSSRLVNWYWYWYWDSWCCLLYSTYKKRKNKHVFALSALPGVTQ